MKLERITYLIHPNCVIYQLFGLYSFLYPRFRRQIELVGKARLRIHPSTSLVLVRSKMVVENGVLKLGLDFPLLDMRSLAGSGYDLRRDSCRIHLYDAVLHTIGDVCLMPSCQIIAVNSEVVIGNRTFINGPTYLFARGRIRIGEDCLVARGVTIMDTDHHRIGGAGRKSPEMDIREVVIGNHCWIGENATILKGVTVGDGAIIAANSVVTDNVPEHTLVAGVPARVIRKDVIWEV